MQNKERIQWWMKTYNDMAYGINNARSATAGNSHPAHTFLETKLTPTPHTKINISNHHLRLATDTYAAQFICAYAAHRAAWEETHGRDRSTRLWKATAVAALISAIVAITTAISGGAASTLIVATVLAIVLALATWPVARWNLASKRDAFYHCLSKAVESAGEDAAHEYIQLGAFEHRTIVHNLDDGLPLTPKQVYRAIERAADKAKV